MTDSNATELLRKILDERGVSHVDHGCNTAWTVDGESYSALERNNGSLSVAPLTPEQAIAATLGSESVDYMLNTIGKLEEENERLRSSCGTLTAKQVRKVLLYHLPHREYYSVEQTDAWQAIADELNEWLRGKAVS